MIDCSTSSTLAGVAVETPVMRCPRLDECSGAAVYLKAEPLQRSGSFKFRGAYNAIARLSPEERARGVLTYSSGNHAQAIAQASRILGVSATIVMPENAPEVVRTFGSIEQAEEKMDLDQAEHLAGRFAQGEFTLEDFQSQIKQMKKMGPLKGILKMMPGMNSDVLDKAKVDDKQFVKVEAITAPPTSLAPRMAAGTSPDPRSSAMAARRCARSSRCSATSVVVPTPTIAPPASGTPRRERMLRMWLRTVSGLIFSCSATSQLHLPPATRRRISC